VRRAPAHAGSLKPWERLAFALAFALMAAFVGVITVSAGRARQQGARPAAPAVTSESSPARTGGSPGGTGGQSSAVALDRQLAVALAPVLLHARGNLAIGVIDRATGVRSVYNSRHRFPAASIVKADILAALLLQHQRAGTVFGAAELGLAAQMIDGSDGSDGSAASDLWAAAGDTDGVAAANADLGLRHTTPGQGASWSMISTTVADQLRLLTDLTSARSPLTAASRSYELGLMRRARAGQAWGVPVAATASTSPAVQDGGRPGPRLWAVNSIGVIRHAGQELLVAVLCDGQRSKAAGIVLDQAAVMAAVTQITPARRGLPWTRRPSWPR